MALMALFAQIAGAVLAVEDDDRQQVVLRLNETLPLAPAQAQLLLQFEYTLEEGLDGFYRSGFLRECWGAAWEQGGQS